CHQTHTLINKKLNLKGWDYLESAFAGLAKNNSRLIDPAYLVNLSTGSLAKELKIIFSEDGNPKHCTLDRLAERSKIILEVAKVLNQKYQNKVSNLVKQSGNRLINNGQGLYELLAEIKPYNDPLKKKSTVFIQLAASAKLLKIKDPQNIIPPVDYHLQRVLLRLGCIEILNNNLKIKLQNRKKVKSDYELRAATVAAIKSLAPASGRDYNQLDYLFWSLGRSCCNQKILCQDQTCNKKPCTLTLVVNLPHHDQCIFASVCRAATDKAYRKYWQPNVETNYY
ncbi:MAG: queuosine salvage family protein, partial [Patescibacteria group bacterium]